MPNLEILCDDVICSHGSSVGPIEENVYHYVMARGIEKVDADKLLIKGFFNEVINDSKWEIIHDKVSNIIEKKYMNIIESYLKAKYMIAKLNALFMVLSLI